MTDADELAIYSFIRVLTRRLVDKGVFTDKEMVDLHDAWFGEVLSLGAAMQEAAAAKDIDNVLQMIHALTVEFTPK